MKKTIKAPIKKDKEMTTEELSYDKVLESFKKSADRLPKIISDLQKADEEQWGRLFEEVSSYAQNNKELSKIIREEKDGLHIGEQSWTARLLVTAFMFGYSVGSACYRSGTCDYTKYVD